MAAYLHQTVAVPGGYEFLRGLEKSPVTALPQDEIAAFMLHSGIGDPDATLAEFLAAGLLARYGDHIGLTTLGIRTVLLLEALNHGDLRDVYRRLSRYDSTLRMYELVREGMARQFLQSINNRPGFSRLYFCSPWISLEDHDRALLAHAIVQAEKRGAPVELFVIMRPVGGVDDELPESIRPFRDLKASIFLNRRLHTKLYIREPDHSGGYSMAIVGSENLTKSRYLELGIRINADSLMVNQLIGYFWELANASVEA